MCRSRLWLLYWVSTQIFLILELARLDSAKSTSRYTPPNGTAGLARSAVSGASRVPAPPASTIPRTVGSGTESFLLLAAGGVAAGRASRRLGWRSLVHPLPRRPAAQQPRSRQ